MSTVTGMAEDAPKFTIWEDHDPDGDLIADDPVAAHLTYREDVRIGLVVDMGLSLEDFRQHIARLRERRPLGCGRHHGIGWSALRS
jgi:hypothetical protein